MTACSRGATDRDIGMELLRHGADANIKDNVSYQAC